MLTDGDTIELNSLPEEMALTIEHTEAGNSDLKQIQAETEQEIIERVLKEVKYNKALAAKLLNINRATLYYKIAKYNIDT